MFKLFSIVQNQLDYAFQHYRTVSSRTTGIVEQFIRTYQKEGRNMASTIEKLNRKIMKEAMESATVKDRLKGLTAKQVLNELPTEEVLKALPAEVIEAYLRTIKKEKP